MLRATTKKQRQMDAARRYLWDRLSRHGAAEPAEILRDMERELERAPSRSTFYQWVREWRDARERDKSGTWTLATDETGRPDLVMKVLAELITFPRVGDSPPSYRSVFGRLTAAEARWIVRLAIAVPDILRMDEPDWRTVEIRLLSHARDYVDAESAGDTEALAELDGGMALLYIERESEKES